MLCVSELASLGDYPAYTWQEILWEYPTIFFHSINAYVDSSQFFQGTRNILELLQQKKYDEADLYFRENCILIKNKK